MQLAACIYLHIVDIHVIITNFSYLSRRTFRLAIQYVISEYVPIVYNKNFFCLGYQVFT